MLINHVCESSSWQMHANTGEVCSYDSFDCELTPSQFDLHLSWAILFKAWNWRREEMERNKDYPVNGFQRVFNSLADGREHQRWAIPHSSDYLRSPVSIPEHLLPRYYKLS